MNNSIKKGRVRVVGIDIAKQSFQLHGVEKSGQIALRKKLSRVKLTPFIANLPPCIIGMEACGGAHHWYRVFTEMGHTVHLIAPRFVKEIIHPDERIVSLEKKLELVSKQNEDCQLLLTIPGIGMLAATALVARVGNPWAFKSAREMAAWLGLVPRQHLTGGKPKLLGISKRGDKYLRRLLVHGGRSVVQTVDKHKDYRSQWIGRLEKRRGRNISAVAVAKKLFGNLQSTAAAPELRPAALRRGRKLRRVVHYNPYFRPHRALREPQSGAPPRYDANFQTASNKNARTVWAVLTKKRTYAVASA